MEAYKTEAVLDQNSALTIDRLPFPAGQRVEIIILAALPSQAPEENAFPLSGPYRYDDPFEPAVPLEDWEVMK